MPGAAPITADELFSGQQAWSNLTDQERSRLLELSGLAGKEDQQWLSGFFRSGGVVNDSTFGFRLSLVVRTITKNSDGSASIYLGP